MEHVLTTERLVLRPVTGEDHAGLLAHWTAPEVRRFLFDGTIQSPAYWPMAGTTLTLAIVAAVAGFGGPAGAWLILGIGDTATDNARPHRSPGPVVLTDLWCLQQRRPNSGLRCYGGPLAHFDMG